MTKTKTTTTRAGRKTTGMEEHEQERIRKEHQESEHDDDGSDHDDDKSQGSGGDKGESSNHGSNAGHNAGHNAGGGGAGGGSGGGAGGGGGGAGPGGGLGLPAPHFPVGFSLTPYGTLLNLTDPEDKKLYNKAIVPLGIDFDGQQENAPTFIDEVKSRVTKLMCSPLFEINIGGTTTIELYSGYSQVSSTDIQAHRNRIWRTGNWISQAAYIMGEVFLHSLTQSFKTRIIQRSSQYLINVNGQRINDGPSVLWVIMTTVFPTNAMSSLAIRGNLANVKMSSYKYDLIEMQTQMNIERAKIALTAHAVGDSEMLLYMLKAYQTAKCDQFVRWTEQVQNEAGGPVSLENIINRATDRYLTLKQSKEWDAPSQREEIIAMKAENERIKKQLNKSKSPTRPRNQKPSPTSRTKASAKNPKAGTDPEFEKWLTTKPKKGGDSAIVERDGRKWTWCKYHKRMVLLKGRFGKHTSTTCHLNPKNDKKKGNKKVKVNANAAEATDAEDDEDHDMGQEDDDESDDDESDEDEDEDSDTSDDE